MSGKEEGQTDGWGDAAAGDGAGSAADEAGVGGVDGGKGGVLTVGRERQDAGL